MSDLASPLPGVAVSGIAEVRELGLRGMITIKGDLALPLVNSTATGVSGVDFPDRGQANYVGERGLCWMAPDEIMVLTPYAEAAGDTAHIAHVLRDTHSLVANVSDARCLFEVSGASAREVLSKLTPADMHPDRFRPGAFRRTRLAQVPAAVWMRDDQTIEVFAFRSAARYVSDLLANAARPGTAVGYY
ncbi:MAG: sarcosine oxidase subunit gamma [Rhodobacteraceae bacterium]|nr:sarcosine oxidase subunit gamma [Paracoccaceae bacterium]